MHIRSSFLRRAGRHAFIVGTFLAIGLIYFMAVTRFRGSIADFFGLSSSDAWMPVAMLTIVLVLTLAFLGMFQMERSDRDLAGKMTPRCSDRDGGVLYTGFSCPCELNSLKHTIHQFTFRNDDYREAFELANVTTSVRLAEADDWAP